MTDEYPRVLLVEDDRVFSDLLSRQFTGRDIKIVVCGTGQQALDTLKKDTNFGVILLDISLPDIDGFEVLEQARAYPGVEHIPVVVVSNFTIDKDIEWGSKLGVKQFVKKISVMPADLVEIALAAAQANAGSVTTKIEPPPSAGR